MNGQAKKIEDLTTNIETLQKQNADLQRKVEKVDKLAQANTDLSQAKEQLQKQLVICWNDLLEFRPAMSHIVRTVGRYLSSELPAQLSPPNPTG